MGLWLKQSTAISVKIGPFLDETNGKDAEVGLTLTQADIRLSKNGGDIGQKTEANNATTDELGYYDCPLDETDTGTLGILQLFVHEAGALPVFHEYMVVPANVWDSFFGADVLHTDLTAAAVDTVWDELMAGHVTPDSAAYVMRSITTLISDISQAQDGAAGSITLAAASSAVNDYYKGQVICIALGAGAGQARACYAYNGGTKVASIRPAWATAPDNTSYYAILNAGSAVVAAIEDIDLSATMKASVNAEVDNALDTAIPGGPTADSVNEVLKALSDRLPANYIMGSSVNTDKDDEIDAIKGYIDTEVAAIKAVTDTLSLAAIADAVHDEVVEGTTTLRQAQRLICSALFAKTSGGGTNTLVARDIGDTKPRITLTTDANGNRTASVTDAT